MVSLGLAFAEFVIVHAIRVCAFSVAVFHSVLHLPSVVCLLLLLTSCGKCDRDFELNDRFKWWTAAQAKVLIERQEMRTNNYLHAILAEEGGRTILYLECDTR